MFDPSPDPQDLLSDAAAKIVAEPVSKALSPAATEVGALLGEVANMCRFYATRNLEKICTKWAESRHGKRPLNAEEFQKVMPLFPAASMVGEDELQAKWARLMESATSDDGHSPAYGQTLSQLSVEDVRFLDRLWSIALTPSRVVETYVPRERPFSFNELVGAIDPGINPGVNDAEFQIYGNRWTEEQIVNYKKLRHARLIIDNVIRVGILRQKQEIEESERVIGLNEMNVRRRQVRIKGADIKVYVKYSFSSYGVSFMDAVTAD
jgi:hypothetical protein